MSPIDMILDAARLAAAANLPRVKVTASSAIEDGKHVEPSPTTDDCWVISFHDYRELCRRVDEEMHRSGG